MFCDVFPRSNGLLVFGKGKGKVHPRTCHEGPKGESLYSSILLSTSTLDGVGGQPHAPAALPPERHCTQCTAGWVGLSAGLDGCGKTHPPPEFDLRTLQPVA